MVTRTKLARGEDIGTLRHGDIEMERERERERESEQLGTLGGKQEGRRNKKGNTMHDLSLCPCLSQKWQKQGTGGEFISQLSCLLLPLLSSSKGRESERAREREREGGRERERERERENPFVRSLQVSGSEKGSWVCCTKGREVIGKSCNKNRVREEEDEEEEDQEEEEDEGEEKE